MYLKYCNSRQGLLGHPCVVEIRTSLEVRRFDGTVVGKPVCHCSGSDPSLCEKGVTRTPAGFD